MVRPLRIRRRGLSARVRAGARSPTRRRRCRGCSRSFQRNGATPACRPVAQQNRQNFSAR